MRVEQTFGKPQDIEWAYEGDALYVLQTRPITTPVDMDSWRRRAEGGAADRSRIVWSNVNVGEALPGVATEGEISPLVAVWEESYAATGDFQESIKDALLVVLTSPQFLFLVESSRTPEPESLGPYELASKLSYFLWNSPPDEELLRLAATDTLHDELDRQISRMIDDPQFERFTNQFTSQWLSLDKFDVLSVDRERYPKLTRDTRAQLRAEPIETLQYLIRENVPLRTWVESDFILANEVVASYYDLGDHCESGFEFVPIPVEQDHLGGILSQAAILAGLSDGREANPVKRGAWVARKIIAEPPDDPPPNVPALPEDGGVELTLRQKLERHRNQEGCAKCHEGIDPWGLPFEQYDAGGLFNEEPSVDARSILPDETEVADAHKRSRPTSRTNGSIRSRSVF